MTFKKFCSLLWEANWVQ